MPPVTFSTLACPQWSVETVIQNARVMGYDGIEWRGGSAGHINAKTSHDERAALRARMRDANLFSLALTGYTSFVSDDPRVRAANVDELKRYLDLAADIQAQYVRVFLGELEPHQTLRDMYPRIIDSLRECVRHAHAAGVGIAIEHHDDFEQTAALVPILAQLRDSAIGAVWDIANAYSAGESADDGAQNLRGRISYVQLKDGTGRGNAWRLTNVGAGDVDLARAVQLLREQNYPGAFSIEWEYTWNPELEPPERALPQALEYACGLLVPAFSQVGTA